MNNVANVVGDLIARKRYVSQIFTKIESVIHILNRKFP